jgi:hypothetical protein
MRANVRPRGLILDLRLPVVHPPRKSLFLKTNKERKKPHRCCEVLDEKLALEVMDHTQIEALAHAIAAQSVLDAWPYWLTLLGLVFLGVVIGSFAGSYAAKRGEVKAARADREEILEGLRETTEAAEEVRSAVSLEEWTERERRALRRTKLEEMLLLAWKVPDWLMEERNRLVFDEGKPQNPSPQSNMMALGSLYFPELNIPLRTFDLACDAYHNGLSETRQAILAARIPRAGDEVAMLMVANEVRDAHMARLTELFRTLYAALRALDGEAAALMATIIAPPD